MNRLLKFFGKYMTYIGLLTAIGGLVYSNVVSLIAGLVMVTIGCLAHEFNE